MDPGILLLLMVLFLFYEGMSGNPANTLKHLGAAVRIYSSLEFSQTSQMINEVVRPVLQQLRSMAITLETDVFPDLGGSLKTSVVRIQSFKDADREIDILTKTISDMTYSFASMSTVEQADRLGQLQKQLSEWKDTYTQFAESTSDCMSPLAEIAAAYIDIRYLLLEVRLSCEPWARGQTMEGAHLKDAQRLVSQCQSLFISLKAGIWTPDAISKSLGFRVDPTTVLSYVLMHCHYPAVRMPVLRLLKIWCRDYGSSGDAASLSDLYVLVDVMTVLYGLTDDWTLHSIFDKNDFVKASGSKLANVSCAAEIVGGIPNPAMISSRQS